LTLICRNGRLGILRNFTKEFSQFHESKSGDTIIKVNPADLSWPKSPLVINFIPKPIGETELEI
jgi:hypothetical protein